MFTGLGIVARVLAPHPRHAALEVQIDDLARLRVRAEVRVEVRVEASVEVGFARGGECR